MGATKYRKKPVVIDAMRFDGTFNSASAVALWVGGQTLVQALTETDDPESLLALKIGTMEGDMLARPGDWIIRGVKGEFYPCKPYVFEATYERADADDPDLDQKELTIGRTLVAAQSRLRDLIEQGGGDPIEVEAAEFAGQTAAEATAAFYNAHPERLAGAGR